MSCSIHSLRGGSHTGDCLGEYCRGYFGDARSSDYSSCGQGASFQAGLL